MTMIKIEKNFKKHKNRNPLCSACDEEGNLEFVLCTSLRRYFLRRDLLLEKRKDNHVKSRLKNADI